MSGPSTNWQGYPQETSGLGQRKITLSTSGLVPKIKMLGDFPPVNIAISLHSAKNDVRTQLMPINKGQISVIYLNFQLQECQV